MAKQNKETFLLRHDFFPQIRMLTMEQWGRLLTAIYAHATEDDLPEMDDMTKMGFGFIKTYMNECIRLNEPYIVRHSRKYAHWRRKVLERDRYTCQICGQSNAKLHVHHVIPFSESIELRMDVDNGVALCVGCHKLVHHHKIRL